MDTSIAADELARELIESASDDWIRDLVDALDREVRTAPLARLQSLWDLSSAGAARIFGVSRQAYSKWLVSGPPADRVDDVVAMATITDLLDRYVKRERIPAVVRRVSEMFSDQSILDVVEDGAYGHAADLVSKMFDLRRVQP